MFRRAFTKYHGLSNDYLFIDLFTESPIPESHLPGLAKTMSHRRRGAGSDGIVIVSPESGVDARMRIFNPDGSEAENCGNALRCIAKMLYERGHIRKRVIRIKTGGGIVDAFPEIIDDKVHRVSVHMGKPVWQRQDIPMTGEGDAHAVKITLDGTVFDTTCLSVGNPHCVIFSPLFETKDIPFWGSLIETHPLFPRKINAGFCRIENPGKIDLVVWERSAGLTNACGTGATAAFAAARLRGLVNDTAEVKMPGGILHFREDSQGIIMTGPAVEVYSGVWHYSESDIA